MQLQTILNRCHHFQSFVYGKARLVEASNLIEVGIRARKGSRGRCRICGRKAPTYDTATTPRRFRFVPLWGFAVVLLYCMRRVQCPSCGIHAEGVPWASGKNRTCDVYRLFLATWARRLSWGEVGRIFGVSWGVVYRSIAWVVAYGRKHRDISGVTAIGVDEMAIWSGHRYVTVVYQIDEGMRRLLWVGRERTEKTLQCFFDSVGQSWARALLFVASDMWKPYLKVVARNADQALHVLDRFHIVAKLHKAVDEVRAKEAKELAGRGRADVLKHSRWPLLKNEENLTDKQALKLTDLLRANLRTVRAWLLKDTFDRFWRYSSDRWAGRFLDLWCTRAMRSRLEPLKRFARTLRAHRPLLLNWFRARKTISSGVVEAMNGNAKFAIRKARGFRSYEVLETALYHCMGRLPEPEVTHRFC